MGPAPRALRSLGLTEYGARAYAALLSLGPAAAEDVAKAAPVPRTKVYAVLAELQRREWIDAEEGRPRKYRARPPRECVERERARLGQAIDEALPALEAAYRDRGSRFAGALWIVSGPEALAERTRDMIGSAKSSVLFVASFLVPGEEAALARALRAAVRRNARVQLAVPSADAALGRAVAGAEVRVFRVPPRILLVDGQHTLVATRSPDGRGGATVRGMYNPSRELAAIAAPGMAELWTEAAPLEGADGTAVSGAASPRRSP